MLSQQMQEKLKKIKNQESTNETVYTIFLLNYSITECITFLYEKLQKIKIISNTKKRKDANDRIFNFKNKLEEIHTKKNIDKISGLFIVSDIIQGFMFNKETELIKHLTDFNVKDFMLLSSNSIRCDVINDIFYSQSLCNIIKINNNTCKHIQMNSIKNKVINDFKLTTTNDLQEYIRSEIFIKENKKTFVIYPRYPKKEITQQFEEMTYIYEKDMTNFKIIELNETLNNKENIDKLEKFISEINNPKKINLLLSGQLDKQIKQAIETYMVKKLFVHKSIKDKFENVIDNEFINFEIIWIDTAENGDYSETFLSSWGGVVGELYYNVGEPVPP